MSNENYNKTATVNKNEGAYAMSSENLRKVKDIAITMLETPVKYTVIFGSGRATELVEHPFFFQRFLWKPEDAENPLIDILSSDDAMQEALQCFKGLIEEKDSINSIILSVNKPYRLQFLTLIQNTLSPDELGSLLADIWMCSKKPNKDVIPLSTLIEWFKKAGRESLMDEEELACYNSLPDEFPVYRGMGAKSCKKGISYTLSLETAERFTKRFWKTGYVLTGTAKKKDVLAYFNGRNEQEVLIEPKNISGLHEMQAGLSLDSPA